VLLHNFDAAGRGRRLARRLRRSRRLYDLSGLRTVAARSSPRLASRSPLPGRPLLGSAIFLGEGCMTGQLLRLATVSAMTECVIVRITKADITRVIHEEPAFADDAAKPRHAPDLPECLTWFSTSLAFGFQRRHPIHPLGCAPPGCRAHQDFALRCHRPSCQGG
jgi:hypothetical protein